MGENDAVTIRIDFEASTEKLTDAVKAEVDDIKAYLDTLKKKIDESLAPNDRKDVFRQNLTSIEGMIQKMQVLLRTTKDTTERAKGLSQAVSQMGRVMKGQTVKGYEGTTAKDFADTKKEATATRQEVNRLNEALAQTANKYGKDMLKIFTSIDAALQKGRRPGQWYSKGNKSSELLKEDIALLEKYGEVAGETFDPTKPETYANRLKEIKGIEGELARYYNTGKQEKWGDNVVEERTELVREELKLIEEISRADTDVQRTEETLNEIESENLRLEQERANAKYQLLEVEKQIAFAEQNRLYNGDTLSKEQWKSLQESRNFLREQVKTYDRQLQQNKIISKAITDRLKASQQESKESEKQTSEKQKQTEAEKERVDEIKKAIRAEQENIKQAKSATSQYYYRLRSMKMVNRYLQMANSALDNFGKKAIGVFGKAGKSVTNFTKKFKLFHLTINRANKSLNTHTKVVKSASRAHDDWGKSMKRGLTTLLKYTFGIRSLYVLFNRLRGAMGEGLEIMATQYGAVNGTMSDIVTSIYQMKNALTTAIQPLTTILAPVLAKLAETLSNVTVKIASFFAAFTGQKTVYKAIRVNQQFVDTLKKQKKAQEELNKEELAHYDMLNVISDEKKKESEEDETPTIGFEEIPIEPMTMDWVNKLKDLLKKLLEPIINAWNKWKDEIIKSLKQLWASLKKLLKDILRDFLEVWSQPKTQEIFEKLFESLRNIIDFIRIIIDKIDEAWNHARNGFRILQAIRDIIWILADLLVRCTRYAVEWAKALDLKPLFTAIADVLEGQVVPAVQKLADLTYTLFQAFMEIVRYLLEEFGPSLVRIYGDCAEIIGNIAENVNKALSNGDDIFDTSDRLYRILQSVEGAINSILDGIKECTEATVKWSKELNFEPLFATLEDVLKNQIQPAVKQIVDLFVYLYKTVVLPMAKYLIEDVLPQIERILGNIIATVGNIAERLREAFETNSRGEQIVSSMAILFQKVADAIEVCSERTRDWATQINFAPYLDSILNLLDKIQPVIQFISNVLSMLWTNVVLPFVQYLIETGLPKLNAMLGEIASKIDWEHLTEKVKEFLTAFEKFLEKGWETFVIILGDIGEAIADFVNSESFDHIVDTLIKWMNEADPEDMAKGIEQLVIHFIKLKAALSFVTMVGGLKEFVMTLINWHNNQAMVKTVKASTDEIAKLKGALEGMDGASDAAEDAANGMGKLSGALSTIGGVASIALGGLLSLTGFLDGLQNGFSITELAATGLGDALIGLGLVALGVVSGPIGIAVAAGLFAFQQLFIGIHQRMDEFGESFSEAWTNLWKGLGEKLSEIFHNLGEIVGKAAGTLVESIYTYIRDTIASYDGNWLQLGIDIIQGMLKIFFLPGEIIKLVLKAAWAFLTGFIDGFREGFDMHSPSRHPEIVQLGVDILGGILQGMIDAIAGFPAWAWDNIIVPIKDAFVEEVKNIWNDLKEIGNGLITNIKEGAEDAFGKLRDSVRERWNEIKDNTREVWEEVSSNLHEKWEEIRSNAESKYEEIRSTIESKWEDVKNTTQQRWNDIYSELSSRWEELRSVAESKFEDIRRGVVEKWEDIRRTAHEVWEDIKSTLSGIWNDLTSAAQSRFEEMRSTIDNKWNEIKDNAGSKWNEVKDEVGRKIDEISEHKSRFEDVGRNLIEGLKGGLESRMGSALDTVRNIANDIYNTARSAFEVHSPSKLFEYIGQMLTEGLAVGIEDDADSAEDAFESLVPGLSAFDKLYDTIISKLSGLRQDAISITDSMVDAMMQSFAKLESLDVLGNVSEKMAKLETMKIPDMVTGKVISPQIQLSVNADTSKLEELLQEVIEKLDNLPTPDTGDSDKSPIVLQLDKSELARAIWDEQDKRYKQLGYRPVYS